LDGPIDELVEITPVLALDSCDMLEPGPTVLLRILVAMELLRKLTWSALAVGNIRLALVEQFPLIGCQLAHAWIVQEVDRKPNNGLGFSTPFHRVLALSVGGPQEFLQHSGHAIDYRCTLDFGAAL
jgi:hypothetical protein